jgi:hypothetical protein
MALNEMIEQRHHPRELVDWLEESVDKNDDESASVLTLDSLVKSGIFRKEKLSVGTRFYLNNQGRFTYIKSVIIMVIIYGYGHDYCQDSLLMMADASLIVIGRK